MPNESETLGSGVVQLGCCQQARQDRQNLEDGITYAGLDGPATPGIAAPNRLSGITSCTV